ncbi:MAG TPA: winged helix-turn-helix domain-containing protein, partial [Thermohalobaculum sp.]|nr:winged helix-turn-helix domain-containing protein [Thermohalobaculum sp.]
MTARSEANSEQNDRDGAQRDNHACRDRPPGAVVDMPDIGGQTVLLNRVTGDRVHVVACKHRNFSISRVFLLHSTLQQSRKRPRGRAVKEMQNRPQKPDTLLEIRLFGAPVFLQANGESVPLPGRKDRALLAYLATHPDVSLARDRLVELLWADSADGAGRTSLRQALSTIRKAMGKEAGALIASDRDTVTLCGEGLVTDLGTLEDLS